MGSAPSLASTGREDIADRESHRHERAEDIGSATSLAEVELVEEAVARFLSLDFQFV